MSLLSASDYRFLKEAIRNNEVTATPQTGTDGYER